MSSLDREAALEKIRKTQDNIAVTLGTVLVMILCIYFFSYAQLADRGMSGALWAEGISSIVIVVMMPRLKHVCFFITRLWLSRRSELRDTLKNMSAKDL